MSATETFRAKAPWIMALLIRDFDIDVDSAASILGNLGHESGGLTALQEISPTVKNSKGGYGWAQWTGPRRREFMDYCERNKLSPSSDQANYKWLFLDLSGDYKSAIAAVKKATSIPSKVRAFELAFERAGVKHYESREIWAARAFDAWHATNGKPVLPAWTRTAPLTPHAEPVQRVAPIPATPQPPVSPTQPAGPQDGTKPDVVLVDGPKKDETTVIVVPHPDNPPQNNPIPDSKRGFAVLGAMLIAIGAAAAKYWGG